MSHLFPDFNTLNLKKPSSAQEFWILFLVIILGAMLRIFCLNTEFWLDEIWSYDLVFLKAYSDVIPKANTFNLFDITHSDNNHLLNTLWLRLLGENQAFYLYRLLSILSSLGTLVLIPNLLKSRSLLEKSLILILCATSVQQCLWSTEARGYATAIFFSLLSLQLLFSLNNRTSFFKILSFWISNILGLLSHGTYYAFFLALIIFATFFQTQTFKSLVKLFLLPLVCAFFLYWKFYKNLPPGTGTLYSHIDVITDYLAGMFGVNAWGAFSIELRVYAGLVTALFILSGLFFLIKDRKNSEINKFVLIFIPVFILLSYFYAPRLLFPRYFALLNIFLYLAVSVFLAKLIKSTKFGLTLGIFITTAIISAQLFSLGFFLEQGGRGQYSKALQLISAQENGSSVGSDQDYRNGVVFKFYQERLGLTNLQYVKQDQDSDWYIIQSQEQEFKPEYFLELNNTRKYEFFADFSYGGNTGDAGVRWILYKKAE